MFVKKTVFILGAGASCHYGYPTGNDLVRQVGQRAIQLSKKVDGFYSTAQQNRFTFSRVVQYNAPQYILEKVDAGDNNPIQTVVNECRNIVGKIKQVDPPVIDHFLNHNPSLSGIGKFLIAWHLLEIERQNKQLSENSNWLRFVFQHMMAECRTQQEFMKNNVSFVTFNYDVSLERQIYECLKATEFFDGTTIAEDFCSDERFIHVYGKIRDKAYEPLKLKEFDGYFQDKPMLDLAYEASKFIRTIAPYEKTSNNPELKRAQLEIEKAEQVFILGYGFDKTNSANLKLGDVLHYQSIRTVPKSIFFTNYKNMNVTSKRAAELFTGRQDTFLPPNSPIFSDTQDDVAYHYEMSTKSVYEALSQDFEFID